MRGVPGGPVRRRSAETQIIFDKWALFRQRPILTLPRHRPTPTPLDFGYPQKLVFSTFQMILSKTYTSIYIFYKENIFGLKKFSILFLIFLDVGFGDEPNSTLTILT